MLLLLWYALKIARDWVQRTLEAQFCLIETEVGRGGGGWDLLKSKIRWKYLFSCEFVAIFLKKPQIRTLQTGKANMINIMTVWCAGEGSQNVSSLEIIVHYMHEHELLKGRKMKEKKFSSSLCTCWLFPGFLFLLYIQIWVGSEREIAREGRETPGKFFFFPSWARKIFPQLLATFRKENSICCQFKVFTIIFAFPLEIQLILLWLQNFAQVARTGVIIFQAMKQVNAFGICYKRWVVEREKLSSQRGASTHQGFAIANDDHDDDENWKSFFTIVFLLEANPWPTQ